MKRRKEQQHGDEKSRNAKAALDEVPRQISTQGAAGIAKLMGLVRQLAFPQVFYDALVGSPRHEERTEGQRHIN